MLKLSRLTDYAVVILDALARMEVQTSAAVIARETGLPEPTVSKILKALSRGGLLTAQRGANGGYALKLDLKDVSVLAVMEAMEGPLTLVDCCALSACGNDNEQRAPDGCCSFEDTCTLNGRWTPVNTAISGVLNGISIADLIGGTITLPETSTRIDAERLGEQHNV